MLASKIKFIVFLAVISSAIFLKFYISNLKNEIENLNTNLSETQKALADEQIKSKTLYERILDLNSSYSKKIEILKEKHEKTEKNLREIAKKKTEIQRFQDEKINGGLAHSIDFINRRLHDDANATDTDNKR